ncbi:MAG: ATP-binding cassette domain-containing protein, partial [Candidatus Thermoplasmatota archaeon]|nr:ATP-binding cassette domain-containing protein [Candidatus Thermoplasmatota archaeon]
MGELSISIRGLYKNYGEVRALDGIDLDISSGEIFGILGPNGSGKTTLLRIMCSILEPTIGYVSVNGLNAIEKPL